MRRNALASSVASFALALILLTGAVQAQVKTCGPGFNVGCGANACANLAPGTPCGPSEICVVLGQCLANTRFYCGCLLASAIEACIDLAQTCDNGCSRELRACSRSCHRHDLGCELGCEAGSFVCESGCSAEIEQASNHNCQP